MILLVVRKDNALVLKSHIAAYTKQDGTFVAMHEDKRASRKCSRCGKEKVSAEFKNATAGYCLACRSARSEFIKNKRLNDPAFREQELARGRENRLLNPDQTKDWKDNHPGYQEQWMLDHPGYHQKWRDDHPEYKETLTAWEHAHPGRHKEWTDKNRDHVNATKRILVAKKKLDPTYKLAVQIRWVINNALRNKGYAKASKTQDILGCSYAEFKVWIESQFTDGMSWDNRDDWHIDHIIPLSQSRSVIDTMALNHYSNLRPLWKRDNQVKYNKLVGFIA